jgi:hypothetical protein
LLGDFVVANRLLVHWLVETKRSNSCGLSLSFASLVCFAYFLINKKSGHPTEWGARIFC